MGKDTQFQPGESGNPNGRPKGRRSLSTVIQDILSDPKFIEKLNGKVADDLKRADPDFQSTPIEAIVTAAVIESINPLLPVSDRNKAREWLAKFGYGTKVDVTSGGKRIEQAPVVISPIAARQASDAPAEAEAS